MLIEKLQQGANISRGEREETWKNRTAEKGRAGGVWRTSARLASERSLDGSGARKCDSRMW